MKPFQPINEVRKAKSARKARQAFYTPLPLISFMVDAARLWPDARVLEPSAGDGRIVHALLESGVTAVDACEIDAAMGAHCAEFGARMVGDDFLTYIPGPIYDAILMNPPFSGQTWKKHIEHAFSLLRPGGQIVAIVPRTADQSIWSCGMKLPGCDYAVYERVGQDWFKEFDTNVKTLLVTIEQESGGEGCDVEGFANQPTCNAALTIATDEALAVQAKGLAPRQFPSAFGRAICELGGSCYGVNWDEVSDYLNADTKPVSSILSPGREAAA